MISFEVQDMSCGHCVGSITQAIKSVDQNAAIRVDLATHRVDIEPAVADAAALRAAIQQAGYTPLPV